MERIRQFLQSVLCLFKRCNRGGIWHNWMPMTLRTNNHAHGGYEEFIVQQCQWCRKVLHYNGAVTDPPDNMS